MTLAQNQCAISLNAQSMSRLHLTTRIRFFKLHTSSPIRAVIVVEELSKRIAKS
jgi:hypothetical protein